MSVAKERPPEATHPPSHARRTVALLGPQTDFAQVRETLDELGIDGPVALVMAGWQEHETDDRLLARALRRPSTNLALHARSESVYAADPGFAAASRERQRTLRQLQGFYRVRLDAIDDAAHAVGAGTIDEAMRIEQRAITAEQLKHLDHDHLERCRAIWERFDDAWPAEARIELGRHRAELHKILSGMSAILISGGHVGSLLNRLRLFDIFALAPGVPVVAWTAGAMVVSERIVLFHDSPPYGKNLAQVLDYGFGLAPGVVVMPGIDKRVQADDEAGIQRFVERMQPALCAGMNEGARLVVEKGTLVSGCVDRLGLDGRIQQGWRP